MASADGSGARSGAVPVPDALADLSAVGWSHRGTPLEVLERLTLPRRERPALLAALADVAGPDVVVLSTCSRTELYTGTGAGPERVIAVLAEHLRLRPAGLAATWQCRRGLAVVEHLFRVTSGLESRIVGEVEIRSQVRGAVREARLAGAAVPTLGPLFAAAGRCAGRVDEVTGLSGQARSLARRAVDIGLARTQQVQEPVVLVVGAGRMARTAVERLRQLDRSPQVAARSELEASRLAGAGAVCPLPALGAGVAHADLLICATSASHDVVTLDHVRRAMRGRSRPLTVVDLSVPRTVDVTIAGVPGVHLIDVEDLHDDLASDEELARGLTAGSDVVRAEVGRYAEAARARAAGPLITAVRTAVEQLCARELARVAADRVEPAVLERAAHSIAGKLLHRPTMTARAAAASGDLELLGVLGELFGAGDTAACAAGLQR